LQTEDDGNVSILQDPWKKDSKLSWEMAEYVAIKFTHQCMLKVQQLHLKIRLPTVCDMPATEFKLLCGSLQSKQKLNLKGHWDLKKVKFHSSLL